MSAGPPKALPSTGPQSLRDVPHPLAGSSSEEAVGGDSTPSPDLPRTRSFGDKVGARGAGRWAPGKGVTDGSEGPGPRPRRRPNSFSSLAPGALGAGAWALPPSTGSAPPGERPEGTRWQDDSWRGGLGGAPRGP